MSPLHVSINFELTGVGLIAVAVWALLFTRRQLAAMQESHRKHAESARNQELQLRASVLLTLDQRWESEPLVSLREELRALVKDVIKEASGEWPGRSLTDLKRLSAPPFISPTQKHSRAGSDELHPPLSDLRLLRNCRLCD